MSAVHRAIKSKRVSADAKHLLVILCGLESLGQKMPMMEDLPRFGKTDVEDLFVELSDEGFILGGPDNYRLNRKKLDKFNVKSAETSGQTAPPAVHTLLTQFKALHASLRRGKSRSSEKDIVQIRFLMRRYDANEVKPLMEQFFREPIIKARQEALSIADFFHWADRQFKKRAKQK